MAVRKSSRASKEDYINIKDGGRTQNAGMLQTTLNSFTILNSCDNEELENIAKNCDIKLGGNIVESHEIIDSMKLEELARAALAEANYRSHSEARLIDSHSLEGENLELQVTDNTQRGVTQQVEGGVAGTEIEPVGGLSQNKKGRQKKKDRGSRLNRELTRISLQ